MVKGKPDKFGIERPPVKILNRCIICGTTISSGFICSNCRRKQEEALFGKRRR